MKLNKRSFSLQVFVKDQKYKKTNEHHRPWQDSPLLNDIRTNQLLSRNTRFYDKMKSMNSIQDIRFPNKMYQHKPHTRRTKVDVSNYNQVLTREQFDLKEIENKRKQLVNARREIMTRNEYNNLENDIFNEEQVNISNNYQVTLTDTFD